MGLNVAVLGASSNPERYSYKAVKMLMEYGHNVFPVHPSGKSIDSLKCYSSLDEILEEIDTITVYLSQKNSTPLIDNIIKVSPRRIILNPGAENHELKEECEEAGIEIVEACTLVMLRTGLF